MDISAPLYAPVQRMQSLAAGNLDIQMKQAELGMMPQLARLREQQIDDYAAQAQYRRARAAQFEAQTATQNRFAQALQNMAKEDQGSSDAQIKIGIDVPNPMQTQIALYGRMASAALAAGDVADYEKLSKLMMESTVRASQVQSNMDRSEASRALTAGRKERLARQEIANATPETWDQLPGIYYGLTGRRFPFAGQPFSPELRQQAVDMSLEAEGKQTTQQRQDAEARRQKHEDFYEWATRARLAEIRAARDARVRHWEETKKAGVVKDVGSPDAKLQAAARKLIENTYPGLKNGDELDEQAYRVASRALLVRKANPGMGPEQAMNTAMQQSREDIQTASNFWGNKSSTIKGGAAHPLPWQGNDPSKYEDGKFYTAPNGGIYKWDANAKGFVKPKFSMPPVEEPDDSEPDDDSDDGEE